MAKELDNMLKNLTNSKQLEQFVKTIFDIWHAEQDKGEDKNAHGNHKLEFIRSEPEPIIKTVEKIIEVEKVITPEWALDLESQKNLMLKLSDYPNLHSLFLFDLTGETDSLNILRFITISSQWETLVRVWEDIAEVCKQRQDTPDVEMINILTNCIKLFNLTLSSNQASIKAPEIGEIYNYNLHHQVSGADKYISKVLLPALYGASDKMVKPAMVIT